MGARPLLLSVIQQRIGKICVGSWCACIKFVGSAFAVRPVSLFRLVVGRTLDFRSLFGD